MLKLNVIGFRCSSFASGRSMYFGPDFDLVHAC